MLIHKKKLHIGYYPIVLEQLIARKRSFKDVIAYIPFFFTICTKDRCTKRAIKGTIKYKRQINTCTFEFVLGLIPKTLFRSFSEF